MDIDFVWNQAQMYLEMTVSRYFQLETLVEMLLKANHIGRDDFSEEFRGAGSAEYHVLQKVMQSRKKHRYDANYY